MAARDRSAERLDRARRIGERLVARLGLEPPVPIEEVVAGYAKIERASIPADCDAVVVGLTTMQRPLVILQRDRPARRVRFSLGHELGHLLIPGHVGIEVCSTEASYYSSAPQEQEAHAFASEVLMPTPWLRKIIASCSSVNEIFLETATANVSAAAACLAVQRLLAPGFVIILATRAGIVEMAVASPGTAAQRPADGTTLDVGRMSRFAADGGAVDFGGRAICWWRFEREVPLPDDDGRPSREILREIIDHVHGDNRPARQHAFGSIHGAASWAREAYDPVTTAEEMHARLRSRFVDRPEHAALMSHPLFEHFLAKKARELTGG